MELRVFRTETYEEFILEVESYGKKFNLIVKEIFEIEGKPYKAIVVFEKKEVVNK